MKLTTESIDVVRITVHRMVLFLSRKPSEPATPISHLFLWLWTAVTLCACVHTRGYVNAWVRAQTSESRPKVGWLIAFSLLQTWEDRAVARGAGALVILPLYLGSTHYTQSKTQCAEEILLATTRQGGVLGVLLSAAQKLEVPCRRHSDCDAGMSHVRVIISSIMGNCQRKRL